VSKKTTAYKGPQLRRLWIALTIIVIGSFAALLYYGAVIYQEAPPIPERVVSTDGTVLFTGDDIRSGQDVWRSIGGHELGSIWGHGAYTAPDWTADWLHREAVWILDRWARDEGAASHEALDDERQAALEARLQGELRTNSYEASSGTLTVSEIRTEAIRVVQSHYIGLFGEAPELEELRESYAMPPAADVNHVKGRWLAPFRSQKSIVYIK